MILLLLANLDDSENVLDVAIASLCPAGAFKQKLLETLAIEDRYRYFLNFLEEEKQTSSNANSFPTHEGENDLKHRGGLELSES